VGNRGLAVADFKRELPLQQCRPDAFPIGRQSVVQQAGGFLVAVMQHLIGGHLAAEFGDRLLPEMIGVVRHLFGDGNCLGPVLFLLVDFQQAFQGLLVAGTRAQFEEHLFGAIEQPGL
jgi:hypothetical protein